MKAHTKKLKYISGITKQVALWSDVEEIMQGRVYGGLNKFCPDISSSTISRAKQRGYFGDGISLRLWLVTDQQLRLTNYVGIESKL